MQNVPCAQSQVQCGRDDRTNDAHGDAEELLLPVDMMPPPLTRYDPLTSSALHELTTPQDERARDSPEDPWSLAPAADVEEKQLTPDERTNEWLRVHGESLVRDYYDPAVNFLEALFERIHRDCPQAQSPGPQSFLD